MAAGGGYEDELKTGAQRALPNQVGHRKKKVHERREEEGTRLLRELRLASLSARSSDMGECCTLGAAVGTSGAFKQHEDGEDTQGLTSPFSVGHEMLAPDQTIRRTTSSTRSRATSLRPTTVEIRLLPALCSKERQRR